VLLYLWRARRSGEEALAQELAIAALISLLISALTWRDHFVLVLLPLIFAWMQSRERNMKARLFALTLISVSIGTPLADFILLCVHHGLVQALLSSIFMLAGWVLLVLCLRDHRDRESIPTPYSRESALPELGRAA
jgi:hypothetical protein